MKREIHDDLVESVILLSPFPWFQRHDVYPFFLAYTILLAMISQPGFKIMGFILFPVVLASHLIVFMMSQFSVSVKCRIGSRIVSKMVDAKKVLVIAAKAAGKDRMVDLTRIEERATVNIAGENFSTSLITFDFQKVTYNYDEVNDTFIRLQYPSSAPTAMFYNSTGHKGPRDVDIALRKWGTNDFDIPLPDFVDLYTEHLVAPFFVFQILCLVLWSLDDYWYYSALTLVMLLFFEGVLAKQRLVSLQNLRAMNREPSPVYVFRRSKWELISSEQLVPGDVMSLSFEPTREIGLNSRKMSTATANTSEKIVPCDALLIRGSCVVNEAMLTGESVPQVKESLRVASNDDSDGSGEMKQGSVEYVPNLVDLGSDGQPHLFWKRHMVFGGTALTQHTEILVDEEDAVRLSAGAGLNVPRAPDSGCHAIVIRTGFGTSQGGLMRKILFATERVNVNSHETFFFIGILVIFAVVSSAVVLHGGLFDESRNQFKLVLHCIMIITSVVPPELPMELSLAVTNSLQALVQGLVYCTEPFRIPYAGRVNMLCFDKTGTLTQDRMNLRGVVSPQAIPLTGTCDTLTAGNDACVDEVLSANSSLEPVADCCDLVQCGMASCQSLIEPKQGSGVLGDPLEVESFSHTGFQVNRTISSTSSTVNSIKHQEKGLNAKILHRYQFSSALKRMSVLVEISYKNKKNPVMTTERVVFSKGAPEIMQRHLHVVPSNYEATYMLHMSMGRRVIALTYRPLEDDTPMTSAYPRSKAESNLIFLGFLVFDSALKSDSKSVMSDLKWLHIPTVIITGDSPYTAADVAKKLGMVSKSKSLLILDDVAGQIMWKYVAGKKSKSSSACEILYGENVVFDPLDIESLTSDSSLCVTGQALVMLENTCHTSKRGLSYVEVLKCLCPHVRIYARVSPAQKESIILAMNSSGLYTLMCGDGTNDVGKCSFLKIDTACFLYTNGIVAGALKAAHVGISVINDPDLERKVAAVVDESNDERVPGDKKKQKASKDRAMRAIAELQEIRADPTTVKLGDASIASPFTARRTSIDSVLTVLKQGRCSLVATIQVYKILALNCLVSAYMMSSLYLQGLKQGDTQMTAAGIATAGLFFFISRAKALPKLSPEKPPHSVFAKSVLSSIIGQFVVHFGCLVAVLQLCAMYNDPLNPPSRHIPDSRFQPNLVNSAVYLLASMIQVNNFVVNYRGHPFTEGVWDNTSLRWSLISIYGVILVLVSGMFEPLGDFLQLVLFPSLDFQYYLGLILVFDLGAAYAVEKLCQKLESQ